MIERLLTSPKPVEEQGTALNDSILWVSACFV